MKMAVHYRLKSTDKENITACGVFKWPLKGSVDLEKVNCLRCLAKVKRSEKPLRERLTDYTPALRALATLRKLIIEEYMKNGKSTEFEDLTTAVAVLDVMVRGK